MDSKPSPLSRLITSIQICSSLNHRKKKKTEPCRLISQTLAAVVQNCGARTTSSARRPSKLYAFFSLQKYIVTV